MHPCNILKVIVRFHFKNLYVSINRVNNVTHTINITHKIG